MSTEEAKQLVKKIKFASFGEAVEVMKMLERINGIPKQWWFPKNETVELPHRK